MSMDSAVTMGAAASKKCREERCGRAVSASVRAGSVRGPVATMQGASGSAVTRRCSMVISGWAVSCRVTSSENLSRSTASAAPAGTRLFSAAARIREFSFFISAFRRPEPLARCSAFRELEQTSSAQVSM